MRSLREEGLSGAYPDAAQPAIAADLVFAYARKNAAERQSERLHDCEAHLYFLWDAVRLYPEQRDQRLHPTAADHLVRFRTLSRRR